MRGEGVDGPRARLSTGLRCPGYRAPRTDEVIDHEDGGAVYVACEMCARDFPGAAALFHVGAVNGPAQHGFEDFAEELRALHAAGIG